MSIFSFQKVLLNFHESYLGVTYLWSSLNLFHVLLLRCIYRNGNFSASLFSLFRLLQHNVIYSTMHKFLCAFISSAFFPFNTFSTLMNIHKMLFFTKLCAYQSTALIGMNRLSTVELTVTWWTEKSFHYIELILC